MAKDKNRIPKKIGGVKVPKPLRKQADKALRFTDDHPVIGEVVASALLAAAAALTRKTESRDAERVPADLVREAKRAGDIVKQAAREVGEAVIAELGKTKGKAPVGKAKAKKKKG